MTHDKMLVGKVFSVVYIDQTTYFTLHLLNFITMDNSSALVVREHRHNYDIIYWHLSK